MSRKGLVYFQEMLAGALAETDDGYEFIYQANYLENKNAKPVSLTLPLSTQKYESKVLFVFPDCLGPVTTITGYNLLIRNNSSCKSLCTNELLNTGQI